MNKKDVEADKKRTALCKKLFKRLFGKPFPKGWTIHWHVNAMTSFHDEAIFMGADSLVDPYDLETFARAIPYVQQAAAFLYKDLSSSPPYRRLAPP